MILALILWGNVLLRAEITKDAKNSNSENFESARLFKIREYAF